MESIDREFDPRPGQISFGSFHPFFPSPIFLLFFFGKKNNSFVVSLITHIFFNSFLVLFLASFYSMVTLSLGIVLRSAPRMTWEGPYLTGGGRQISTAPKG